MTPTIDPTMVPTISPNMRHSVTLNPTCVARQTGMASRQIDTAMAVRPTTEDRNGGVLHGGEVLPTPPVKPLIRSVLYLGSRGDRYYGAAKSVRGFGS